MIRNLLTTGTWFLVLGLFFRWWDLTSAIPWLALWSCVFVVAFAITVGVVHRGLPAPERARLIAWAALIVIAAAGNLLVPQVNLGDARVRTVVWVKVLDTVIPLWIMVRALIVIWSGRARVLALAALPVFIAVGLYWLVVSMPGDSHRGALPPLAPAESTLAGELEAHVRRFVAGAGERNHRFPERLEDAAGYIDSVLTASGLAVVSVPYFVDTKPYRNLEITITGNERAGEVVVIGAHYDAVEGAPGADDNASGTAAMLALAKRVARKRFARTIRFVAFTNEEPPFFNGPTQGSRVYAARVAERGDDITAMLSLETVGYYSDEAGSQKYPPILNLMYPDRGDFIGFVGNMNSRALVRRAIATFRGAARFPSEGAAAPALLPGISWSDHEAFWRYGWQAIMITDTAPFRNPHYHLRSDTPDQLDYGRMARVVTGLEAVITDLANN